MIITQRIVSLAACVPLVLAATALGTIYSAWQPQVAQAQDASFVESVRQAREDEARGDYNGAGNQYYSLLDNNFSRTPIPYGMQVALGRRAVACLTIAARTQMQTGDPYEGWAHCEALNMLEIMWRKMQKLEPNNPTWTYLMATRECSQGRYADAKLHLQASLRTTGGQPSVRKKAQLLLGHINKYANQDSARMAAADAAAVKALMSGQFMTNMSSSDQVSSSSSGSSDWQNNSVSDSERRAREAENAGDSGAASRFRSGGTTVQDHAKYW